MKSADTSTRASDGGRPVREPASTPPVLELKGISLVLDQRRVLDSVDLTVPGRGEVCGILGSNGAGKTSLLKVVTGLVRRHSGTVLLRGEAISPGKMPDDMGALIEEPRFYPWLSARDNLLIAAGGRSERLSRVDEALDTVGLRSRASDRVKSYSQGMRQRLGIARALLAEPSVVLLDEPANGLDPEGICWLRGLLASLSEREATVLVTSHVLAEIQRTCRTVAVMSCGKIVAHGTMESILADFSSLEDLYFGLAGAGSSTVRG